VQKSVIERKELWKQNASRTNPVNLALRDSKEANRQIAKDRSVNASSASVKSKAVAANQVAVAANKAASLVAAAVSNDKPSCVGLTGGGRRLLPPVLVSGHVQPIGRVSAPLNVSCANEQ
jgi:hypothetical protein